MKQSGGFQRHKPLVGNLDTHRAWQHRSQERQRAKPRARPSQAGESRARRLVYARSQGLCEMAIPGVCTRTATEWCHRLNRSQGGLWLASHGLHGCSPCHRATTNTNGHRALFETNGWVLRRHQNPLTTAAQLPSGWAYLTDDGTTIPKGAAA